MNLLILLGVCGGQKKTTDRHVSWISHQPGENKEELTAAGRMEAVYNASMLLDTLMQDYDNRLRPDFGGGPTLVDVNLNVRSMGPVSETDMTYQMDCYFRQSWVDQRLEFNISGLHILQVSVNVLDRLWKPDTHFFNGQRSYLHTVTSPNKLLRINRNGRILYSMRLTIKASCPMHLENFPMDIQTCPLQFGSHGYAVEDVIYSWTYGASNSIKMATGMRLSQFDLIDFPAGNATITQPNRGDFSILQAQFSLRRHMGYFLINIYVPCSLLVVISWVGFWINREATSDRIALGTTTVLTMTFLGIDNRRDLPKVSYSTALDYFVATCFAFVLATVMQFSGVHFFTKFDSGEPIPEYCRSKYDDEEEEEEIKEDKDKDATTSTISEDQTVFINKHTSSKCQLNTKVTEKPNGETNVTVHYEGISKYRREHFCSKFCHCIRGSAAYRDMKMKTSKYGGINSVSRIDRVSRILFPFMFLLFHVFYWTSYLIFGSNGPGGMLI